MKDTLGVLLAGGAGERLYPLTRDRAKPAVTFGGMYRIIDITLSNCLNSDLRRVYILTQYKALSLNRHIREGWNILGREVGEFVEVLPPMKRVSDQWYQGTADAVYQNIYSIGSEQPKFVLILSGDHIYKMDYGKMMKQHLDSAADVMQGASPVGKSWVPRNPPRARLRSMPKPSQPPPNASPRFNLRHELQRVSQLKPAAASARESAASCGPSAE